MKVNTSDPQNLIRLTSTVAMSFVAVCLLIMTALKSTEDVSPPKAMERLGYGKVQQWEWFGGKKVAPVVKVVQQNQKLQDVKIDADLLGVMISGNDSSATIKFKGRPEQVFQQGDKLNSTLELVEIQPFRVIVTENGIKKQLMMKKPDVIIQSEPITTGRAESSSQGFALANMFGAVPVNIAGGKGFKINNLSSSVKALADIRDGDVVVQVDGLSVQDLMSNPMKMMTLSKANSVPVTVMRNGRQEIIYVNAASLSAKMLPILGFNP